MHLVIFKVLLIWCVLAFAEKCKEEFCGLKPARDINNELFKEIAVIWEFYWACNSFNKDPGCGGNHFTFQNQTLIDQIFGMRNDIEYRKDNDCKMKKDGGAEYSVLFFEKDSFCISSCNSNGKTLLGLECYSKTMEPSQDMKKFTETLKNKGLVDDVYYIDTDECPEK